MLQVVTEANEVRIDKWKEEIAMTCEALERIMAPELKAKELKGRLEGKIEGKVLAFAEVGLSVREIALGCLFQLKRSKRYLLTIRSVKGK